MKKTIGSKKRRWIWLLCLTAPLVLAVLTVLFFPKKADGEWHEESRLVLIGWGVIYAAMLGLLGMIAAESLGKNTVLLIPLPILGPVIPVILIAGGLIYGFTSEPDRYQIRDGITWTLSEDRVYLDRYSGEARALLERPADVDGYPVAAIGNRSFRRAEIDTVVIPESVGEVGKRAFAGSNVRKVVFRGEDRSDGRLTLRRGAFRGCAEPETVIVGAGRTELEKNVFCNCDSLKWVWFRGECVFRESWVFLRSEALTAVAAERFTAASDEVDDLFQTGVGATLYSDRVIPRRVARGLASAPLAQYPGPRA